MIVFGPSDEAIAETAIYFLSLECSKASLETSVTISYRHEWSRATSSLVHHALAYKANPPRNVTIYPEAALTKEVGVIIATQPRPIDLDLDSCRFEDEFIEYLQRRHTPFGSLALDDNGLGAYNMRLFCNHLSLFDTERLPFLPSELVLKAIASPITSIDIFICDRNKETDVSAVDIVLKKVSIHLSGTCSSYPTTF